MGTAMAGMLASALDPVPERRVGDGVFARSAAWFIVAVLPVRRPSTASKARTRIMCITCRTTLTHLVMAAGHALHVPGRGSAGAGQRARDGHGGRHGHHRRLRRCIPLVFVVVLLSPRASGSWTGSAASRRPAPSTDRPALASAPRWSGPARRKSAPRGDPARGRGRQYAGRHRGDGGWRRASRRPATSPCASPWATCWS